MTDFASALFDRLTAAAAVAALVVADGKKRVYPVVVPQDAALPYIRYQTISDPRPEHLEGYDEARAARVQVDCFAATYKVARDLAEKVIAAMAEPASAGGIAFGRSKAEGPRDLGDEVAGTWVYRTSIDLTIEHRPA